MKFSKEQLKLYAITDRAWLKQGQSIFDIVEEAIKGGATMIQVREKNLDRKSFIDEVIEIIPLCHSYGVPVIVNDDLSIAIESKADGVHLGQSDLHTLIDNKDIPSSMIVGISVQNVEQALIAKNHGATYLGIGAIFPTDTKKDADNLNIEILKNITSSVQLPIVGIGGINKSNIPLLKHSGISGISLISAIFAANNIKEETQELSKIVKKTNFNKKTVIFDADGTLLDSVWLWDTHIPSYLNNKGIIAEKDLNKKLLEMTFKEGVKYLKSSYKLKDSEEEIEKEIQNNLLKFYKKEIKLFPGIKNLLQSLKNSGYDLMVASATDKSLLIPCFENLGISNYFDAIETENTIGISKGNSLFFKEIMKNYQLSSNYTIVVDDSCHVLESAKKNNLRVIGIQNKSNEKRIMKIENIHIKKVEELNENSFNNCWK